MFRQRIASAYDNCKERPVKPPIPPLLFAILLFAGMRILLETGRPWFRNRAPAKRIGRRARQPEHHQGCGVRVIRMGSGIHVFGCGFAIQRKTGVDRRGSQLHRNRLSAAELVI